MTRNTAYKILNPVLALLAAGQGTTAYFKDSMTGKNFELFHVTCGIIFLALIVLHIVLNFNWIRANYFYKKQTDYNI